MIPEPDRLYTSQDDIARLEARIQELPDETVVEIGLTGGGTITGTVSVRPAIQVFRDARGDEGFNALVRIDDQARPEHAHYLWIDRIASITRLGSA